MKKLVNGLLAVASAVGLVSAFAFSPKLHYSNPTVRIIYNGSTYSYTTGSAPTGFECTSPSDFACTITTTIPVATLNSVAQDYINHPPLQNVSDPSKPYVHYFNSNKVWQ